MTGWRGRIGLIVPSSNTTAEPEFRTHAPEGVSVHAARMALESVSVDELDAMSDDALRAASLLADADCDVIAYACTTGSLLHGPGFDSDLEAELAAEAGVSAVATALSVDRALRALDAERIAVVTPYTAAPISTNASGRISKPPATRSSTSTAGDSPSTRKSAGLPTKMPTDRFEPPWPDCGQTMSRPTSTLSSSRVRTTGRWRCSIRSTLISACRLFRVIRRRSGTCVERSASMSRADRDSVATQSNLFRYLRRLSVVRRVFIYRTGLPMVYGS